MNLLRLSFAALAVMAFAFAGCGDKATEGKKDDKKQTAKNDDHDHGHDHEHKHGPNGGSHFKFEGTEDFAAEVVTYGENDLVKVMFCTVKGDKTVPLKAEKVSIARTSGEEKSFDLEAISPNEEGMTDGFELEDKGLKVAVEVGAVKVTATIDGKEYTGTAHPHNH